MRKIILGILALLSVQFAFVTYMMVLQSPVELTATEPNPIHRQPIRVTDAPRDEAPEPETEVSSVEPLSAEPASVAAAPHTTASRVVRPSKRSSSRPAFDPAPAQGLRPGEFKSVVIRYNRNAATSDCDHEISKPRERALVAKAGPAFKPWKWVKSVASKLN